MKRVAMEGLGLLVSIAGVVYLTGWDDTAPLYGVVVAVALMLLRWVDLWSSGRNRTRRAQRRDTVTSH